MTNEFYLDIKSEALRNVLREVLKNVPEQSLRDDMPTVTYFVLDFSVMAVNSIQIDPRLLFHYVPTLRSFNKNYESSNSLVVTKHVNLLEFMEDHYGSTARRLQVLLKQQEISFDLLRGLYRPNDLIHTTCSETEKPRCVRFVSAEVKTSTYKGK